MRFGDMCFNIFMRRKKNQDSAPSRVYRLCGYLLMINTNESRIKSWNNSGKVKITDHLDGQSRRHTPLKPNENGSIMQNLIKVLLIKKFVTMLL